LEISKKLGEETRNFIGAFFKLELKSKMNDWPHLACGIVIYLHALPACQCEPPGPVFEALSAAAAAAAGSLVATPFPASPGVLNTRMEREVNPAEALTKL
jgi:hypothetical protein